MAWRVVAWRVVARGRRGTLVPLLALLEHPVHLRPSTRTLTLTVGQAHIPTLTQVPYPSTAPKHLTLTLAALKHAVPGFEKSPLSTR